MPRCPTLPWKAPVKAALFLELVSPGRARPRPLAAPRGAWKTLVEAALFLELAEP